MWVHEAKDLLASGKKVTRQSWPKGDFLSSLTDSIDLDLDQEDQKELGMKTGDQVEVAAGTLVYNSKGKAIIGYVLLGEDNSCQDWEEFTK